MRHEFDNSSAWKPKLFFVNDETALQEYLAKLIKKYTSAGIDIKDIVVLSIYNTNPQRAIAMWHSLPQKQAPLQDDGLSEDFFCLIDFLWRSEECDEDALTPLLDAVQRDDTLAEMVFRSHYVCTLHLYLIQTAIEQGKTALAEHLYAMLQLNPLPREKWREEPDAFTALMKDLYNTAGHVPTYQYCSVQVGNNRPYAYLTAGLSVKRGDRVRVPYGKRNEPKEGVVRSVGDYTRDTAPWPPEKTKRVLEILPKPQEPAKKEPAAPKPQQVEDETANPKASPVTEEAPPTSGADRHCPCGRNAAGGYAAPKAKIRSHSCCCGVDAGRGWRAGK